MNSFACFLLLISVIQINAGDDLPFNVLVINPDDLRPSLGCYGIDEVYTPNIDRLAKKGVLFRNAFVNQAICNPSRSSFMTGLRPDTTKVWNFLNHVRQTPLGQTWKSIPQHFKENGYFTSGGGKSFHNELPPKYDGNISWSIEDYPYMPVEEKTPCNLTESLIWSTIPADVIVPAAVCPRDAADNTFFDHKVATHIIGAMNYSIQQGKPFFLWAGFFKPHSPYIVPKRVFDRYTVGDLSLPKHKTMEVPLDFSDAALFNYNGVTQAYPPFTNGTHTFDYGPQTPLPDAWIKLMRAGYYSSITWMDEQVGRLLDALEDFEVADNTIIIFFSDNGISMGENSMYMKSDTWDRSTRVPFIIAGPRTPNGKVRTTPVELIDVFPTLASLAKLPIPSGLEGKDLTKVIRSQNEAQYKNYAAFSQHPRCGNISLANPWLTLTYTQQWTCIQTLRPTFSYMGYTVRTKSWRYTEWRKWVRTTLTADWSDSGFVGAELYDHRGDESYGPSLFDDNETYNLYYNYIDTEADTIAMLKDLLRSNFDPYY
jgi:iduronate 2-sulfatase